MMHVARGRHDDAWQDLLACHRLGRLLGRGPTLIEGLVSVAIDVLTAEVDLTFLASTNLRAKQIQDCLRDLQKLPPIRKPAAQVDVGERFLFLDIVMMAARRGPEYLEPFSGLGWPKITDATAKKFWGTIDWEPTMRTGNQWYDRLVAVMRLKDRASRESELDKLETDFEMLKKKLTDSPLSEADLTKEPAKILSKALGDILLSLFFPAVRRVQQSADRAEQVRNNLHVAFALAAYQRDHGRYPAKLER